MRGQLKDLTFGAHGEQYLTMTLREDFRDAYDALQGQDLEVTIKKYHKKRSLDANAYFHLLVNKIAAELNASNSEIKQQLVKEYGALLTDNNDCAIVFKLPATVNVSDIYPYTKCFDQRIEDGILFNCHLVYKRTREMDSKEYAHLIDGAIQEAKELGIDTTIGG